MGELDDVGVRMLRYFCMETCACPSDIGCVRVDSDAVTVDFSGYKRTPFNRDWPYPTVDPIGLVFNFSGN